MKKSLLTTAALSVFAFLFSVTSCKNFLNGGTFIEELEQQIAYSNAPTFTVTIAVEDKKSGDILSAPVKEDCRVSDIIHLDFSLSSGYNFICWQAVQKSDTAIVLNDFVEFKNSKDLTTTVTIKEANEAILNNDLLIRPVAVPYCSFTENSKPVNTSAGAAKDSAIYLELTNKLSASNDLSKIKVEVNGQEEAWGDHFFEPVFFEGDQAAVLIAANTENRIEVASNETKTVRVTIPSTFNYETGAGAEPLGSNLIYEYKINSSTSDKILIQFGTTEEESGSVKINKQSAANISYALSIGEEIDVIFKLNDGFKFHGFSKSDKSAVEFSFPEDLDGYIKTNNYGYNPSNNSYAVHVRGLNYVQNLSVTAETTPLKERTIKIASGKGKVSPNITTKYYEETRIQLSFSPDAAYAFVKWIVKLGDTDVTDKGYVTFTDAENEDTTATFNTSPEDGELLLSIEPYCVARPMIIQTYPTMEKEGSYSDSNIQITFDQNMDPNSIYFSAADEELKGLTKDTTCKNDNSYYVKSFKISDSESEERIYAYKKDGIIYFKNIVITDSIENKNLLDLYDCPFFETPDTLIIPVIRKSGVISGPTKGSKVSVTISNNFFYSVNSTPVKLSLPAKWLFTVNGENDTNKPTITTHSIKRSKNKFDSAGEAASVALQTTSYASATTKDWMKRSYVSDYLEIAATITDAESYPANNLVLNLYKIYDSAYEPLVRPSTPTYTKSIPLYGNGNSKSVSKAVNISDIVDITNDETSGIYDLTITATDNAGNSIETAGDEYILIDHTAPIMPNDYKELFTYQFSGTNNHYSAVNTEINFSIRSDLSKDEDTWKSITYNNEIKTNKYNVDSFTATGLAKNTRYPFKIVLSDIFGNTSEKTYDLYSQPLAPTNFNITQDANQSDNVSDKSKLTFTWTKAAPAAGLSETKIYKRSSSNSSFSNDKTIAANATQTYSYDYQKETSYEFCATTIDNHGNESEQSTIKSIITYPKRPSDCYISFNKPVSKDNPSQSVQNYVTANNDSNDYWIKHPLITKIEIKIKKSTGTTKIVNILRNTSNHRDTLGENLDTTTYSNISSVTITAYIDNLKSESIECLPKSGSTFSLNPNDYTLSHFTFVSSEKKVYFAVCNNLKNVYYQLNNTSNPYNEIGANGYVAGNYCTSTYAIPTPSTPLNYLWYYTRCAPSNYGNLYIYSKNTNGLTNIKSSSTAPTGRAY